MTNRNKEIGLFGIAAALFGGTVAAVPFLPEAPFQMVIDMGQEKNSKTLEKRRWILL